MIDISWLGQACFKIKSKGATLLTDPYNDAFIGLKLGNPEADIVTVTHDHQDHNYVPGVKGEPFVIKGPGEYEVKGVNVLGVATFHDTKNGSERGLNTVYNIEVEGVKIAHMGDLGQILTNEQVEELGSVDVLLVPVGGVYTIEADEAAKLSALIEPKIVIPMHYKLPGLKPDLDSVEKFLKEMGKERIEPAPKISIRKDKLPEELQIIVLEKT